MDSTMRKIHSMAKTKIPVKRLGRGYYCQILTDTYGKVVKFNPRKHVEAVVTKTQGN